MEQVPDQDMPQTANLRRQLAEISEWWSSTASHYVDPVPLGAVLLAELTAMAKDLSILQRDLEASLYDKMDDRTVQLDGIGVLERSRAAQSEKFESDKLIVKVVDTVRVDAATGEVLLSDDAVEHVLAVLNKALPLTPSLGWRKRGLAAVLGDEWKDYYEKVPGRKTVRFL